jgi:GT2 family glycosyltransferase
MTADVEILGFCDDGVILASSEPLRSGRVVVGDHSTRIHGLGPSGTALGGHSLLVGTGPEAWALDDQPDGVTLGQATNPAWQDPDRPAPVMLAVPQSWAGPVTATYTDPILGTDIPVRPEGRYRLTVRYAAHRADAHLVVTFCDAEGDVIGRRTTPLSTHWRGGTSPEDYGRARMVFTAPAAGTHVRLSLRYDGRSAIDTRGSGAFVFLTDWRLTDTSPPVAGVSPRRARQLHLHPPPHLSAAQLPPHLDHGAVRVEVRDSSGEVLAETALRDISAARVRLRAPLGNVIPVIAREYSGDAYLYIDGHFVVRRRFTGPRARLDITIPDEWWDGERHTFELRDDSRLRTLARNVDILPTLRMGAWARSTDPGANRPYQLPALASLRYRALSQALNRAAADTTDSTVGAALSQVTRAHQALVGEQEPALDPLVFPEVPDPEVTVLIPAHNHLAATYRCLAALLLAGSGCTFEVVVVDDGSTDETRDLARIAPGVRVVRHETAQGFNGAVMAGAAVARGRYLALLNNDTEPLVGWLDELVAATSRFARAGMVGSRLIYPDGRLQEAGGLVWGNGEPMNVGNRGNPWNPRFSYARQVDYLSGAALLMPIEVWHEVGGLSQEFAPAYFEDTDLAFKVREAGYTTWYVPSSIVVHQEGLSNGTDVDSTTGLKRFQEINRPKFVEKWREAFAGNGDRELDDVNIVKDRNVIGRVLFIDHRTPRPDQDAGSYAAVQEMLLVQSLGYKVTLVALDMAFAGDYTEALTRLGIEVVHTPYFGSVIELLDARGGEFDAVYITRYNVAVECLDAVRRFASQAAVLFNNADLHFLRLARAAAVSDDPEDWERVELVRETELEVMRKVDVVLSYNEVEHAVITSHNLAATTVTRCPWVVHTRDDQQVPGPSGRSGIAFLGGYRHPPNVDAALFFATEVMPLLAESLPGVPFFIYGSALPESLQELASDTVRPIGYVESLAAMHDQHRVFVAPLRSGAGIKGKVLGALADGIPTVLSPLAAEGTGVRVGIDAWVASSAQEWADAVTTLYTDEARWRKTSASGLALMRDRYSFEQGRVAMATAFETGGIRLPANVLESPGPINPDAR